MRTRRLLQLWAALALALTTLAPTAHRAVRAETASATALAVSAQPDGMLISLQQDGGARDKRLPHWPGVVIGGYDLPAQLVTLRLENGPAAPRIERLTSVPWDGPLPLASPPAPQTTPDGTALPALDPRIPLALPDSPLVVLREATLRGIRLAVVAITPLYAERGEPRLAMELAAHIPGASPFDLEAAQPLGERGPFLASPAPPNDAAARAAWTVRVTQVGMHRLSGAALVAAGVETANPARLRLRRAGREVALEVRDGGDGRLDPGDEVRFYAPTPGDRWNDTDIYWLTLDEGAGRRMAAGGGAPAAAPLRTTAVERGVWRESALYDSTMAGPDGDHWFAADLRAGPGTPSAALGASLAGALPAAPGQTELTIAGGAYTGDAHQLRVTLGAASQTLQWSGAGSWSQRVVLPSTASSVTLALIPGAVPDGVEPDSIAWSRPAVLDFGGRGAWFSGVAGTWRYQLAGVLSGATLYDITDPEGPLVLALPPGASPQFQDGPAERDYLLAGEGTLHTPSIQPHAPVTWATPRSARVLYIAPAELHAALAPLVDHRRSRGYRVEVIDAQQIYDAWSYGQVSPAAIRAFLRYAAATWPVAPQTVTLVGDGTVDPHNYTGRGGVNLIPPYMAMVDPWLGETACEACYAQLDGDDPLDDALPDLALGRLPAKSAAELSALVTKIVGYETAATDVTWQSRALFVADNYRDAAGAADSSGDFAAAADAAAALLPDRVAVERVYYDPWLRDDGGAPRAEPWREPDAARARARTIAALGAGAGIVTYIGHSHTWQWAVTDPASPTGSMLGLFDPDGLANAGRLPVVLAMTCMTAAFQTPARSGTTIDERLLLAPGGAAAVWGSTGMGVEHGHKALLRGFLRTLSAAPSQSATMGGLALAGMAELFVTEGCCQDTLRTYALLGDPLTPVRLVPAHRIALPAVRR